MSPGSGSEPASTSSDDLGNRVTTGVRWVSLAALVSVVTTWVTSIALARLLERSQFGLAAMAMLVVAVLALFQDSGLHAALIQRQERVQDAVDAASVYAPLVGIFLGLICIVAAPLAARILHDDGVTSLVRALSLVVLLRSFAVVPNAVLQKELMFARRTVIATCGSVLQMGVVITLAVFGAGAWAVVGGQITSAAWAALLLWWVCPMSAHPLNASFEELRELLSFGRHIVAGNVVGYVNAYTDSIIISRLFGSASLGAYTLGSQTARYAVTNVTNVSNAVVFPAYSKLQEDIPRFRRAYLRSLRFIVAISMPVSFGLIILSHDFITVVYGHRWEEAAPVMAIIAVQALLLSIAATTGEVFKAAGRPGLFFRIGLLHLVLLFAFIAGLYRYGITGVAGARAATTFVVEWLSLSLAGRILGIRLSVWVGALRPSFIAAALMAVGVLASRTLLRLAIPTDNLAVLVSLALEGATLYLLILRLTAPDRFAELMHEIGRLLGGRAAKRRLAGIFSPSLSRPKESA